MDESTVFSYQDVGVVAIFNLQHVANETVSCQTIRKILLRLQKALWFRRTEILSKIVIKVTASIESLKHSFSDVVNT
jgi:hypothetical protein